jgi:hypothetical protein
MNEIHGTKFTIRNEYTYWPLDFSNDRPDFKIGRGCFGEPLDIVKVGVGQFVARYQAQFRNSLH